MLTSQPDPLKSSILRESGMGWTPEAQNNDSITSPLRIAKRESPLSSSSQLARRTSSSYRHVRNNNLVSKSPFKSQIPTPSTPSRPSSVAFPLTRRVSGEKRPRPQSIHEQVETESERPFALKRERRQSKGFQNLLVKEPVSKSPFRLRQSSPSSSQTPTPESRLPTLSASQLSDSAVGLRTQTPSPNTGPSPARSSLVSRRLHGPRLSGLGRRERRKTVMFVERCDVIEFAPDEEEEEPFASADDEMYGDGSDRQDDDDDAFFYGMPSHPSPPADVPDDDSIHLSDVEAEANNPAQLSLDFDVSITDEMFVSNSATGETSIPARYSTPPRVTDIPPDLETENGVPLGRSHHVERSLQHHQQQYQSPHPAPPVFSPNLSPEQSRRRSPSVSDSPSGYPFNIGISPRASPLNQTITPSRRSTLVATSTPPLGRSIRNERVRKAREEEAVSDIGIDNDFGEMPVSPSPVKKTITLGVRDMSDVDMFVPPFDIVNGTHNAQCAPSQLSSGSDPFAHGNANYTVHEDDLREDSFNLSIGNSEISLTGLGRDPETLTTNVEREQKKTPSEGDSVFKEEPLRNLSPCPRSLEGSRVSPLAREHGDSPIPRTSSPLFRATSPLLTSRNRSGSNTSITGRQRITREDVQRRLLKRRSFGSPAPDIESESMPVEDKLMIMERDEIEKTERGSVGVAMSHEHETRESITSFSRNADGKDLAQQLFPATSPMNDKSASPATEDALDELESLGILTRMSENDAKMGSGSSGSSGSSGNSSATAVETANIPNIKMEFNDVDMDMKSALDRLMDDVAGVGGREGEDSMMAECDSFEVSAGAGLKSNRAPLSRAMTEPTPLLHTSTGIGFSPDKDRSDSSIEATPPPLPPKDNIRAREQMILEKRREMRQLEAEADEESEHSREYFSPPRPGAQGKSKHAQQQLLGVGRPSRRRSMSTGDADLLLKRNGEGLLNGVVGEVENNDALADSIEKEFRKLAEPQRKAKYQVREREGTIYASSSDPDGVSHMAGPGDVNTGKAWRTVRRPSDMNEYAKQIREYRAQAKPGKAYGKVFVKILGIKNMHLPLPQQSTSLVCTLNNGIHFVTTPESQLGQNTRIDQEFELIEQNKLEFTLTLKVKRDPHIIAQFKALSPAPAPPVSAPVVQAPSKGGMRSFFYSTPKKATKAAIAAAPPPPVQRLPENLARYMKPDGTLARVFVAFKDIAARCDTRLFETSYPLIGQRLEVGGKFSAQQVGELVLQIFRLPPLPGIAPDQLPQSLDECCRGLRHINWHKVTYFEGTLTQNGGDCTTWRRRRFRVIGAALVAFNDVTKKATATIDLKKAIAVEDDQQGRGTALGPSSSRTTRYGDEYDVLCGVERSFRLIFPKDEGIVFFADSDEEKAKWLEIFRALVGHIPPHPLWGELLWQRQEELTKRAQTQVLSQALSHPSPQEAQRS